MHTLIKLMILVHHIFLSAKCAKLNIIERIYTKTRYGPHVKLYIHIKTGFRDLPFM